MSRNKLLQGTLELLILKSLAAGSLHGWGVSERIQDRSEDVLQVPQGSVYPALQRLERKGLIRSEWGSSENNRRARFYELTDSGRVRIGEEVEAWDRFANSVYRIIQGP